MTEVFEDPEQAVRHAKSIPTAERWQTGLDDAGAKNGDMSFLLGEVVGSMGGGIGSGRESDSYRREECLLLG